MKTPETTYHHLIDSFTRQGVCFALYRLPWTDEPILVMQEEGEPTFLSNLEALNQKKGFLLAPFQLTEARPAVLIQPDIVAHDWENIKQALQEWSYRHKEYTVGSPALQPEKTAPVTQPSEKEEKERYTETFSRFILPLKEKQFRKLVLSRSTTHALPPQFSPLATFIQACNSYPRMMISLCHTPSTGTWIGSTPEIILSGHEKEWHTVALAGTMPMQGETMPTEWSKKNQEEQAFVGEYIRKTVKKFGTKLTEKGPYTARAGQLVHLKTDFHFCLKDTDHLGHILQELHPTPAVCGLPKEEAYRFILQTEPHDRLFYSGIIGWIDPEGDTTLYVNLRCMHLEGNTATLYAGGGILPDSTADSEWEETQQKMNTMRNILSI